MIRTLTRSPPYLNSVSSPTQRLGARAWLLLKLTNQKPAAKFCGLASDWSIVMGVASTAGALRHEGSRLSLLLIKTKETFS